MGPSVKFVSAIKDAIFNKKNGGKFFFLKKSQTGGGGPRGVCQKTTFFPVFFCAPFPKQYVPGFKDAASKISFVLLIIQCLLQAGTSPCKTVGISVVAFG